MQVRGEEFVEVGLDRVDGLFAYWVGLEGRDARLDGWV